MPKCKSCGADITWVKTASGKSMPLDVKSEKRFIFLSAGQKSAYEYQGVSAPDAVMYDTYTSHFATCPNAAQHRKAKP